MIDNQIVATDFHVVEKLVEWVKTLSKVALIMCVWLLMCYWMGRRHFKRRMSNLMKRINEYYVVRGPKLRRHRSLPRIAYKKIPLRPRSKSEGRVKSMSRPNHV